jgi:hypothetical protein
LIVTSLLVVGADGVPAVVTSFGATRSTTLPLSAKIVGHGVAGEQGAGEVTFVTTSDDKVPLADPPFGPPRVAVI